MIIIRNTQNILNKIRIYSRVGILYKINTTDQKYKKQKRLRKEVDSEIETPGSKIVRQELQGQIDTGCSSFRSSEYPSYSFDLFILLLSVEKTSRCIGTEYQSCSFEMPCQILFLWRFRVYTKNIRGQNKDMKNNKNSIHYFRHKGTSQIYI